eukprot:SM000013S26452  [mRNA]  locus=s13:400177:401646:- [translate_table: standard]
MLYKSEDTTDRLRHCVAIVEDTRNIGQQTLVTLHEQGEQIRRTHEKAVKVDQALARGEKVLGTLGPIFSFRWKPKKGKKITGPTYEPNAIDPSQATFGNPEDRKDLMNGSGGGGTDGKKGWGKVESATLDDHHKPDTMTLIKAEKDKQDAALDDLSGVLGQLKDMSLEMGSEMERQNVALDELQDDVTELNSRVKQANERGRRLLRR